MKRIHAALLAFVLFVPSTFGQEESVTLESPGRTYSHAIQVSPLFFLGSYALNYEYQTAGGWGFVVSGALGQSSTTEGYGGGINLRRYASPRRQSGFWGLFYNFADTEASFEIEDNEYSIDFRAHILGANIGKRWIWNNGFNIVGRIGYGVPLVDLKWIGPEPDANEKDIVELTYYIASGLDAEFSLGYAF